MIDFLRLLNDSYPWDAHFKSPQLPWSAILVAVAAVVVLAYQEHKVRGSTRWWIVSVNATALLLTPAYAFCRLGLSILFTRLLFLSRDFEAVNLIYIDADGKESGADTRILSRKLTIAAYCLSGGCLDLVVCTLSIIYDKEH